MTTDQRVMKACAWQKQLLMADSRDEVIGKILTKVRPHHDEFDAIVVSGYSMAIPGSIIAYVLNKELVIVRKEEEPRTSCHNVEGFSGQRCVFIDDLVSSGKTLERCIEGLKKLDSTIVGIVVWFSGYYGPDEKLYNIPVW